jgi:hypothetical protein
MTGAVTPESGRRAADVVIDHLKRYGPNARVLILAPDVVTLIQTCTDGPNGLMTVHGGQFPGSIFNEALKQMNHERGGQVLGLTASDVALNRHVGQIFTLIWAENEEEIGPAAMKSARSDLRTNEIVKSLGAITV